MAKTVFLTSSLGGYTKKVKGNEVVKEIIKCDNSNHFIDRLKMAVPKIKTFVFVASNPDGFEKTDEYANTIVQALNLDDFGIKKLIVIDHRFSDNIEETILSADVVFLAGGNVPTQNEYFKEIGLKSILNKYQGVVVGQSAGSINCAEEVYVQPECREEFYDKDFVKLISGLALTKIKIQPHMNRAKIDEIDGTTTFDVCLEDSYTIPHYGIYDYGFIEINEGKAISFGKTLLFKNGECVELCGDGEKIEINDDYSYNLNTKIEK